MIQLTRFHKKKKIKFKLTLALEYISQYYPPSIKQFHPLNETVTTTMTSRLNDELAEEIDSVNAIYDSSTITLTSNPSNPPPSAPDEFPVTTTIILRIPNHLDFSFLLGFDSKYPATPPRVIGTASTSSRGEGEKWLNVLRGSVQKVWQEGFVCLYDVIEECGERFGEMRAGEPDEASAAGGNEDADPATTHTSAVDTAVPPPSLHASFGLDSPPDWVISDPITEKKSVFVARVARVQSTETAKKYLDYLLGTEKKIASATHNITAWRIKQKAAPGPNGVPAAEETIFQDFDDDGETAAGARMLHLMQLMDVWDVVVVVTRWYGGVKLGPDRFRIINTAARDALLKAGFTKSEGGASQEKGKKKGRR
ncbi:impact family protein [Blastomyces gilchristii SLH14081]|uniref:Impact family protein n=1 Tax=Blastomyces gilchristii (strain SLH14081) TaxID=559298 RepID=A0A179UAC0_BLAGS|nr:impact family protein [Blastomyces gilchristii SLH14081]OAT04956.1 impact family protein [Blastomyces gilchristii SLH14081]